MMTLDEAIKHCEDVMLENLEKTRNRNASDPVAKEYFECADEYRQYAEWLKELKQFRQHREEDYSYHTGYTQRKREEN